MVDVARNPCSPRLFKRSKLVKMLSKYKVYSTHTFDFFKKRNIQYVKPLPLLGSVLDIVRKPLHEIEDLRRQKYGRIYGHFEGIRPVLSVADPTLLRDILVKDFHIFPQRR
ncbi:cytochrome P450 3A11, partial [Trichonephila inaurata madagascariensis]